MNTDNPQNPKTCSENLAEGYLQINIQLLSNLAQLQNKYNNLKNEFIKINTDLVTKYEKHIKTLEDKIKQINQDNLKQPLTMEPYQPEYIWKKALEPGITVYLLSEKTYPNIAHHNSYNLTETIYSGYLKIIITDEKVINIIGDYPNIPKKYNYTQEICTYVKNRLDTLGVTY